MTEPGNGDHPYDVTWEEFRRKTPRVYGEKRGPDEEPDPATATAMVEQLEQQPSPFTIEGMIAGLSKATSAIANEQATPQQERAFRWGARVVIALVVGPTAVGVVGALFHWW